MSNPITLINVASAAGVSESTVSLVMNGKAASRRISPTTQARVLAVARQLGYQSDPTTRGFALRKGKPAQPMAGISDGKSQTSDVGWKKSRQIGILLSIASQTDIIALIPALEPVLAAEGYTMTIVITPTDPAAIRERVSRLQTNHVSGILSCPSVYAAVSTIVAGTCPVIVLWQGASKAMLSGLGILMEGAAPSAPLPAATPAIKPVQPMAAPKPVSTPVPTPVVLAPPIDTAPTERRPPLVQEPDPPVQAPITEIIPPQATQQPSTPTTESPPTPVSEPVSTPTDSTEAVPPAEIPQESPTPEPAVITPVPEEPIAPVSDLTPIDTAPTERRPPLVQEPETPVLAPITEIIPPPTTQQPSNPTTESPPTLVSEPVPTLTDGTEAVPPAEILQESPTPEPAVIMPVPEEPMVPVSDLTPIDTAPTERRPPLVQEPEPTVLAPITEIIPPPATQQPSNPTTESPPTPVSEPVSPPLEETPPPLENQQPDNSTTESAPVAKLTRKGSHRQLELNLGPWQTTESEYA